MSVRSARPLFVDTSALYARFVANAPRHDAATALFRAIREADRPFRPLLTSNYVCSELATLLLRKAGHDVADRALQTVRSSDALEVLHPNAGVFEDICTSFRRYDDHQISFADHATAVLADRHDVAHVFAFDDDFRRFDLTVVPADLPES